MNTIRPTRVRVARALAVAGAIAISATGLAACSEETSSGATSAAGNSEVSAELTAELAELENPLDAYPVPTESIEGVSTLSGKTLYYIPITQQSPQFAVTLKTLTQAAEAVGLKVQVCDGKGTPTDVSSCVGQATKGNAGTIITDGIPYVFAANAFDAAQQAGIPVIISNQVDDPDHPESATLTSIRSGGSDSQAAIAKWIIADSGADTSVLINQSTDGKAPAEFLEAGKKVYAEECPNCTITVNEVSSGNFSLIPSSTSSALLKNPDTKYVVSQFEQYLQATQSGVQQAGKMQAVQGVTGAAQLGGLQQLASKNFLYAAVAQASAFQGWVDLDASLRLMLGKAVPDYTIPVRLFTRDSIGEVPLTDAAQESGEWFGPTTFTDDFKKLWAVG